MPHMWTPWTNHHNFPSEGVHTWYRACYSVKLFRKDSTIVVISTKGQFWILGSQGNKLGSWDLPPFDIGILETGVKFASWMRPFKIDCLFCARTFSDLYARRRKIQHRLWKKHRHFSSKQSKPSLTNPLVLRWLCETWTLRKLRSLPKWP